MGEEDAVRQQQRRRCRQIRRQAQQERRREAEQPYLYGSRGGNPERAVKRPPPGWAFRQEEKEREVDADEEEEGHRLAGGLLRTKAEGTVAGASADAGTDTAGELALSSADERPLARMLRRAGMTATEVTAAVETIRQAGGLGPSSCTSAAVGLGDDAISR